MQRVIHQSDKNIKCNEIIKIRNCSKICLTGAMAGGGPPGGGGGLINCGAIRGANGAVL
jgi:hypothetical protein